MVRHILVPMGLSDRALRAAERAAEEADPAHTRITLLHVIETIEGGASNELEALYTKLRERAEQALGECRDKIRDRAHEVRTEIVFGHRGPEIIRFAADEGCDLIVSSSHRADPEQPGRGFGTLSHQIALFAHCSVLLVR